MKQILLRGRYVISNPAELPGRGTIKNGAVAIEGEKVRDIGLYDDLKLRFPEAHVIGSEDHVVIPGLVNAHHHGRGLQTIQLGMLDDSFESQLFSFWGQKPLDVYLDTLYANIRLIRSGVTTVIHSGYSRDWANTEGETSAVVRAYEDSGMRVALAIGTEDRNTFVYQDNDEFLASLPRALNERVKGILNYLGPSDGYDFFQLVNRFHEEYADHPRIRILLGPTGPEWCSSALLKKIKKIAKTLGLGIHMHCLESPLQRDFSYKEYGKNSVAYLDDLGILGPRTSLAHGTWIGEEEIRRCADTGTTVCHNASSNLRLRNGIAPVARMVEVGVNVAIGMDGNTLNSDEDMFQEMRLVSCLHGLPRQTGRAWNPGNPGSRDILDILRMATINGARPSTFDHGIGALSPGCQADAVLLDFRRMSDPYLDPRISPIDAVLYLARSTHVDTVVIGGEPILLNGKMVKIDENEVIRELADIAQADPPAHMQRFFDVLDELRPHVVGFYENWSDCVPRNPDYVVNAASGTTTSPGVRADPRSATRRRAQNASRREGPSGR